MSIPGSNTQRPRIYSLFWLAGIFAALLLCGCSPQPAIISDKPSQISITPDIASNPAQPSSLHRYSVGFSRTAGDDMPDVTFDVSDTKLDLPDKLNVYRMVKPEITRDYVAALAAKFGINAEIGPGSEEGFSVQDTGTGAFLSVYAATGTINYVWPSKLYPEEKPSLPSDEEAKKIATDFLLELDLLSEGDFASSVIAGGNYSYGTAHLIVNFSRVIKIQGPGAKHGVRIGNNGEIVAVFVNPTNPLNLPVEEIAPAKSLSEACQEMLAGKTYTATINAKTVKITSFKVVYWLKSIDYFQEYVVPVYILTGDSFDGSGKSIGSFQGNAVAVK